MLFVQVDCTIELGDIMDSDAALRHMIAVSRKSQRQISRDIGKTDTFISATLSKRQGAHPSCALMSDIARACGYDLQLVGHGETITLDGTSKADTGTAQAD